VVNRIGSQIGTAFIDGGIHPKFGTRNFTAPLLNNQYVEVVCPMDHPATDSTPFGQAVKKKAEEGGGWMTWVLSTDDLSEIENKLKRNAVMGIRKLPNGTELTWKQIGVQEIIENNHYPFFIQWLSELHPSTQGAVPVTKIKEIEMNGSEAAFAGLFDIKLLSSTTGIKFNFQNDQATNQANNIMFEVNGEIIKID
jgi:hypothetical protein